MIEPDIPSPPFPPASDRHRMRVDLRTQYLPEESDPLQQHYVFAYHVTITNTGDMPAQVVARHWQITAANGVKVVVHGLGVCGEQPLLAPGESFSYTSGTPLTDTHGTIEGHLLCVGIDGATFCTPITPTVLDHHCFDSTGLTLH